MKWETSADTVPKALQIIRGYLLGGDNKIIIKADKSKEKGRYAITTMRNGQKEK
ncbi:MAG: hypothetical protein HFE66_03945 [Clostridiales bacterium]|jgi:hypothetical protein|nr:hypothetical protein [Clostridiales bacterium]